MVGAAIGVLVAAPNARGQASPPSTPTVVQSADTGAPRTLEVLLRRIQRLLDSSGTPGASLAIVRHDSVLFAGALGLARQDPPQRATAATHFRAGSTGKLFIGLTALALVREGRLVLDQPLREAWPGLVVRNPWEATHPLRLIHLLEHTAGLDDSSIRAYASNDPLLSLEQGLAIDAGRLAARWPPGTRFAYSNVGPAIVAHVIERIEGVPFEQVVQRRWFDRLGMRSATYFEPDPFAGTMATLYLPGRRAPVPYWHVFARPIGALNTTAPDMAALLRLLTGRGIVDGDTLIPPADLDRAEYSRTWSGTRHGLSGVGYGLTLYRTDGDDGRIWAGHAGGVEGGLSDLSYLPTEGRGYSLQVNATRSRALALMSAQVRAFLTADLPPPARPAIATPAADFAARFTGWYRPITPRPQIVAAVERLIGLARVRLATDSLRVEPLIGTASSYVPVDSLTFRPPRGEAATLVFHRDDPLTTSAVMEGFSGGATFARVPLL
ncbi:MAG: beta-lactamase family protein, partial [Gemmatimonadaceae bacterium]|nr:beta-lactamase family protein [Gemmatimonadaceae bacterium]